MNPDFLTSRQVCGDCALKASLPHIQRCVLCGFAILPGSPIALYRDNPTEFAKKPWRKILNDDSVLGCLREGCCPSGGFYAGTWDGTQICYAFNGMTIAERTLTEGGVIIVGDTSDPNSSTKR